MLHPLCDSRGYGLREATDELLLPLRPYSTIYYYE